MRLIVCVNSEIVRGMYAFCTMTSARNTKTMQEISGSVYACYQWEINQNMNDSEHEQASRGKIT